MEKYLPFIGSLIALLVGQFLRIKYKDEPAYKGYTWWGFILSVIFPIVGIVWGIKIMITEKNEHEIEKAVAAQKRTDDSITSANRWIYDTVRLKQILDSTKDVLDKTNEALSKTNQTLATTDSLLLKTNSIYQNITGGNSYCYILLTFAYPSRKPTFFLFHNGNTVLRNVIITIEDLGRRLYLIDSLTHNNYGSPLMMKIINATRYEFDYPSIYPSTGLELPITVEPNQKDIRLQININLDNGKVFEMLEANNFHDTKCKVSLEVKRGNKILKKQ